MGLTSEYEKILEIIDEEKKRGKSKPKELKESKKDVKPVKDNDKPVVGDYQSLDINNGVQQRSLNKSSKNTVFKIQELKNKFRKKLISNYYRIRSYKRPYISVTEVLSCLRKSYYERMKYSVNDNDLFNFPQLLLIQEVGKIIHEVITESYDSFDEVEKVLKSDNYKLKGRVDAIKDDTVFEIKSVDPYEFVNLNGIRDGDYIQGIVYGYILKHEYKYDIKTVEVVYISRDLKNYVVFKNEIDFKRAEELVKKSLHLYDCLMNSIPPWAQYNGSDNECKYCHFKKYCINEKSTQTDLDKDEVKKKEKINTFVLGD